MKDLVEHRTNWLNKRIKLADSLANDKYENEAILILMYCTSAFSASLWPGYRIERKRFCELLYRFGPKNLQNTSTPLLYETCTPYQKNKLKSRNNGIEPSELVYTCSDLDLPESEVKLILKQKSFRQIREFSYIYLFYHGLRCPLVHEGMRSDSLNYRPISRPVVEPTYVNVYCRPTNRRRIRLLRFPHLPYIHIRESIKQSLDSVLEFWNDSRLENIAPPQKWWIDG